MAKREYEKYVVIPDVHVPYEDAATVNTVLNFIRDQQPDHVVLLGDVIDMYAVSKYDKNPARANQLQDEIDKTHDFLSRVRKAAKDAKITYIEGNHEARMQKYLWRNPELHDLRSLQVPELLGLDKLAITYTKELLVKDNFLFTHGRRVSKYAARAELDDRGISGMSGHTHRVDMAMKTDYSGEKVWYSIGQICDPTKAEYVINPNWQQAVGVVYFAKKTSRFAAQSIPINEHKFIYDGKLYHPRGVKRL